MDEIPKSEAWPEFRDPLGTYYSLPLKPPFSFEGMTTRVFPLRARLDSLQRFLNQYLNFIPPEIGRFRAFVPYVYLMLLDYGKLALEVTNMGWLAQREILFSVPMEWYRVVNGKWVFQDWATIAPFIYVDDDLSMNLGRTVYGWPKAGVRLSPTISDWIHDPLCPIDAATLSTSVFPELYEGRKLEERIFLEVDRESPMSNFQWPLDTNTPIAPWVIAANAAETMSGFTRDAMGLMTGLGILPMSQSSSPENYMLMMQRMMDMGSPRNPDLTANTLNLKQFRQAGKPSRYCFQALTNGPMKFTSLNHIGLLGEDRLLLGDVSGGHSLRLHQWPSLPITDTLGLEVADRWRGDGVDIAELKPVMPFWYDVNMDYIQGYNVAWRDRDTVWHDRDGVSYPRQDRGGEPPLEEVNYNTTLSASNRTLAGPFRFSGSCIRVLPLLAIRCTLQKYLDEYLNAAIGGGRFKFRVWGPSEEGAKHAYVYLTATSLGQVTSGTNNIGDWADAELMFCVPVKMYERVDGVPDPNQDPDVFECLDESDPNQKYKLVSVGHIPAFTYVDNVTAATAGTEVMGIPTTRALFTSPDNDWMTELGPSLTAQQRLLSVSAEVLPVVGEGQKAQMRVILEIAEGTEDPAHGLGWLAEGDAWARDLRSEVGRKNRTSEAHTDQLADAHCLSAHLLFDGKPWSMFTLKQFRDVVNPDLACYQSVVRVQRKIAKHLDMGEIEATLMVRINEFPTQPIVNLLGLVGEEMAVSDAGVGYVLQPVRPFWIRGTLDEDLGHRVIFCNDPQRAGAKDWIRAADFGVGGSTPVTTSRTVGQGADGESPEAPGAAWVTEHCPEDSMTREKACLALARIDPQMIIESILSREWGNEKPDTRWRVARAELAERLQTAVEGRELIPAEDAFFRRIIDSLGGRPGEVPVRDPMPLLVRLGELGELSLQAERRWERCQQLARAVIDSPDEDRDPAAEEAINEFYEQISLMDAVVAHDVLGESYGPDLRENYAYRDNRARLLELRVYFGRARKKIENWDERKPQIDLLRWLWGRRASFQEGVALTRERYLLQRDALLNRLSRARQKPDFVVRRDALGADADRLFPLAESWNEEWYVGPVALGGRVARVEEDVRIERREAEAQDIARADSPHERTGKKAEETPVDFEPDGEEGPPTEGV